MIQPNMATMLGIIATDAVVGADALQHLARRVADRSFNAHHRSTATRRPTTRCVIARDAAAPGNPEIVGEGTGGVRRASRDAVTEVAQLLAQAIVRDGEGATKFITIIVDEARDARRSACAVAQGDRQLAAREDRVLRLRPEPAAASSPPWATPASRTSIASKVGAARSAT